MKQRVLERVRTAKPGDAAAIHRLAESAGAGMTSLPADSAVIAAKLAAHAAAIQAGRGAVLLVLEKDGAVIGTGSIVSAVGVCKPFQNYRIDTITRASAMAGRSVTTRALTLTEDFKGCAEVGGLLIDPALRGGGAGRLMARSRYMFIARHRAWYGPRVLASLRGLQDAQGRSPFWDAVGRHFYDMAFHEADLLNSRGGSQFIFDLGPSDPIHVELLPPAAQAALGGVHPDGQGARRLLLEEGFADSGCIDIFDAGATMIADIDGLRAVRDGAPGVVAAVADLPETPESLLSVGAGVDFRAGVGGVLTGPGGLIVDRGLAERLEIDLGAEAYHVAF